MANHKCYSVDSLELSKQYRIPCTTLWRAKHELQPTVARSKGVKQIRQRKMLINYKCVILRLKNVSKYALLKHNYPQTIRDLRRINRFIFGKKKEEKKPEKKNRAEQEIQHSSQTHASHSVHPSAYRYNASFILFYATQ